MSGGEPFYFFMNEPENCVFNALNRLFIRDDYSNKDLILF